MGRYRISDLHDAYYPIPIGDAVIGKGVGWKIPGVSIAEVCIDNCRESKKE